MARLLKQSEAKKLGLPGRTSLEPVSGAIGSKVTFRIAEIAVPKASDPPRGPHLHHGFEECIYVLKGTGTTVAAAASAVKPCFSKMAFASRPARYCRNSAAFAFFELSVCAAG